MTILVQVMVLDDVTGEVRRTFAQTFDDGSYGFAKGVRELLSRVMVAVFGSDDAL